MNAAVAAIFLIGGLQFVNDKIRSAADIYELFNLLMVTLASVIISCMVVINCIRALPSARRINELLDTEPSIKNCDNPIKLDPKKLDIEFKNLSFKYFDDANNPVLSNINLKIKQGEMVGIVGPTGSGKNITN
ncbi:MAG: ABC transporter ATP-binding protein/permease [Mycoplasmoidaceae bacterium]|nr:ABC transporter ATP-binding protein/permease [Mycoplasmoidaceae bacterium]